MKFTEIYEQATQLPLSERVKLVEEIWNSISDTAGMLPITDEQKNELNKRYQDYQKGQQQLHDWKAVHETLRAGSV